MAVIESAERPVDFTLQGYRALLDALVGRGYRACRFEEADPDDRHLLLRHDLDMSVRLALEIAEVEAELGLAATYFVMVRTEMYNPFSRSNVDAISRLIALGHEVGLHLDASLYETDLGDLDAGAERECRTLETMSGRPVDVVSLHRPAPHLQGLDRPIGGRPHAYQPRFFQAMGYCSDSRGGWHYGHPLDHPSVAGGRGLQLLTHPIWWVARAGESPAEKLDRFAFGRFDALRAELARNCDVYAKELLSLDPEAGRVV